MGLLGLFNKNGKKKKTEVIQEFTIESLMQLKSGMSVETAIAIVGKPQFSMDSAEAFREMGFVPKWAIGKQNWVYKTPHGDFQLIVQDKKEVVEVKFIESVITKMRETQ